MQKDSGVTLFELMTVIAIIAIIAILSSIALPGFMRWLPNYRMRSAADELLSTLWLLQKRAVRENADVAIDFVFATTGGDFGGTLGVILRTFCEVL